MFTEQQQSLINQMKAAGYGYAKFASSVEAQGFCTEKQEEALIRMKGAYTYRKGNWRKGGRSYVRYDPEEYDADHDAMLGGDFF